MPRSLDLDRLQRFAPASDTEPVALSGAETRESLERWPSREPLRDGQVSIKAPLETLARFKRLCRDDRRTYADMLRILMDAFEKDDAHR